MLVMNWLHGRCFNYELLVFYKGNRIVAFCVALQIRKTMLKFQLLSWYVALMYVCKYYRCNVYAWTPFRELFYASHVWILVWKWCNVFIFISKLLDLSRWETIIHIVPKRGASGITTSNGSRDQIPSTPFNSFYRLVVPKFQSESFKFLLN